jgi:hypothetical protein
MVVRPKGRTPITCRWVYDIKRDSDNNITLFKARLVVHGFNLGLQNHKVYIIQNRRNRHNQAV